jgi:hypothetical protein
MARLPLGASSRGPTARRRRRCGSCATSPAAYGAVARRLVVSEAAVAKHIGNIFGKLGLEPADDDHRRVLAVLAFLHGRTH